MPDQDRPAPVPVRTTAAGYALALTAAAAAAWMTHAIQPLIGGRYPFLVFPAALFSGLVAGTFPGLACVAAYTLAASWIFIAPRGSLAIVDARALVRLVIIAGTAALVAVVGGRLRLALRRERRLRESSQREIAARTRAEEAFREAHERLAAVQGLTAALSAARSSNEVATAVFRQGLPLVRARAGAVCFQSGEKLAVTFSDDARRDYGTSPLDAPLPTTETARTGRGVWLGSAAEIDGRYPHLAKVRERWGDRAWACTPLRLEGEPLGVLGLAFREEHAFDPSERAFIASLAQLCADAFARARRHDAEHAARARAEAAEETARRAATLQDQVLAVVGHDLRTPLASITMAVAMAKRRCPPDDRLSASLDRIARSGRRMNEIIRDLLDVARARQGIGITLTHRPISADEICEQAIAELQHVHPGRSVRLCASGELRLEGDRSRLLQAVSNLVGNALQHGARDAQVSVEATGDTEGIVIRVRNGGAPIADALLEEIFEPFRRGDGAGEASGSLGLGLFVVREIAHAHGGSVSVSSDTTGTTFELRIPRTPSAAELPAHLHG